MQMEASLPDATAIVQRRRPLDPDLAQSSESDVNAVETILRTKRRRRSQKVCQPCRLRKVKCTYEIPCRSCVERGHADLCTYAPQPSPKDAKASRTSLTRPSIDKGTEWVPPKQEWEEMRNNISTINQALRDLQSQNQMGKISADFGSHSRAVSRASQDPSSAGGTLDPSVVQGISASHALTGDPVYLGGNSVPAMVVALAQNSTGDGAVHDLLQKSILPVFALDNESATYPFVDLWGLPHGSFLRIELLCKLLPTSDSECMHIFKQYRDTAHVIFPGVVDILRFESDLLDFLRNRNSNELASQSGSLAHQIVFGKDMHWLGLLFATLASGFQCSEFSRKERQMKSQVYGTKKTKEFYSHLTLKLVACAYECLRIVNYLSQATLLDLQNLVVLGNVLSNNMNAGVAWALLGMLQWTMINVN